MNGRSVNELLAGGIGTSYASQKTKQRLNKQPRAKGMISAVSGCKCHSQHS